MPRNASGTYSLPAGNPVVGGTDITSSWANTTFTDVATGITDSLDRNGRGGMLAAILSVDGNVTEPGIAWTSEAGTGLYRASAGNARFALLGVDVLTVVAAGLSVTGTLNVSGIIETGEWNGTVIAAAYLPDASLTVEGVVQIATQVEVDAGTDTLKPVTADTLANFANFPGSTPASVTVAGVVELATQAEVNTGTDANRVVTPETLANYDSFPTASAASETVAGIAELATQAEVDAGSDALRIVTPATLAAYSGLVSGPTLTAVKTSNYTASANEMVPCNTAGGAWTLTLPASPSVGDRVYFFDYGETFNTINLTIARNGQDIMNLAEDLTANVQYYSGSLLYIDATRGWVLV